MSSRDLERQLMLVTEMPITFKFLIWARVTEVCLFCDYCAVTISAFTLCKLYRNIMIDILKKKNKLLEVSGIAKPLNFFRSDDRGPNAHS